MKRVVGVLVVAVASVALVGCSGGSEEMPGLTASPTVSVTPSEEPTSTATALPDEIGIALDLSEPAIGFELVDVPTDLEGDAADVYTTLALYAREYWRGLTLNEVSPVIYQIASADIIAEFEGFTAGNVADEARFGGTFRSTISDIDVAGDTATAKVCDNYDAITVADVDGSYAPHDVGFTPNLLQYSLRRGVEPGQWTVLSWEQLGRC